MSGLQVALAEIATARLRLEPLREAHARVMFNDLLAPELYRYIPDEPPESLEALAKRYRFLQRRRSPDGQERWLNWIVFKLEGGGAVGTVQATLDPDLAGKIAYVIFPRCWGDGVGREAVSGMIDHLFGQFGLREVSASIDTRNLRSAKLVEALGLTRQTKLCGADVFESETGDEYRYSVTQRQWRANKSGS